MASLLLSSVLTLASEGNVEAMSIIARRQLLQRTDFIDNETAWAYLKQSAEKGSNESKWFVGLLKHEYGWPKESVDKEMCLKLFNKKTCDPEDTEELIDLLSLLHGRGLRKIYKLIEHCSLPSPCISITESAEVMVSSNTSECEVEMGDAEKAIYFFFLHHSEGIRMYDIADYTDEIAAIYYCLKRFKKTPDIRYTEVLAEKPWTITLNVESTKSKENPYYSISTQGRRAITEEKKENVFRKRIAQFKKSLDENEACTSYINKINSAIKDNLENLFAYKGLQISSLRLPVRNTNKGDNKIKKVQTVYRYTEIFPECKVNTCSIFPESFLHSTNTFENPPIDITFELNAFERFANEGDPFAIYSLGVYWEFGAYNCDYALARKYFLQASELNIADATKDLGDMEYYLNETEEGKQNAIELYLKAAKSDITALSRLATIKWDDMRDDIFDDETEISKSEYEELVEIKTLATMGRLYEDIDFLQPYIFMCLKTKITEEEADNLLLVALNGHQWAIDIVNSLDLELDLKLWMAIYTKAKSMDVKKVDEAFEYALNVCNDCGDDDIVSLSFEDKKLILTTNSSSREIKIPKKSMALYIYILLSGCKLSRTELCDDKTDSLSLLYSYIKKQGNKYGDKEEKSDEFVEGLKDYSKKDFDRTMSNLRESLKNSFSGINDDQMFLKMLLPKLVDNGKDSYYQVDLDKNLFITGRDIAESPIRCNE